MATDTPAKRVLPQCIYCANPPDSDEHWLNQALGTFAGNTYLSRRLCSSCNVALGRTIDQEVAYAGHTGVLRQVLGIAGPTDRHSRNVFDYKSMQSEQPVQVLKFGSDGPYQVFEQAISRNPDGTLVGMQRRLLVISTPRGEVLLPFPRGWTEVQLRAKAEAQNALDGRPIGAHIPAPETTDEFIRESRDVIRAVFGSFELHAATTNPGGELTAVEPTILRFNLSPAYLRGVAKIAFHYFLWACPWVAGDEEEFSAIKAFIRHGVGDPAEHLYYTASLVDRPLDGADCHVFAAFCPGPGVVAYAHFFSQPVEPQYPTFVVRLGMRPASLPVDWRRSHMAVYAAQDDGHTGVLQELVFRAGSAPDPQG